MAKSKLSSEKRRRLFPAEENRFLGGNGNIQNVQPWVLLHNVAAHNVNVIERVGHLT